MLQVKPKANAGSIHLTVKPALRPLAQSTPKPTPDPAKQRRRMAWAVLLLLVAVGVVILKDRQAWFGSNEEEVVTDADLPETSASKPVAPTKTVPLPAPPKIKEHRTENASNQQVTDSPGIVASNRRALPPLDIEVVAGNNHHVLEPANNAVRVDTAPALAPAKQNPSAASTMAAATGATPSVSMSADTSHVVERTVEPSYPTLARQMRVQGAVVLQALIGADGLIQDLKVLSGPAILSSAAREAVRQWRFKPYLEKGKPVETQAKITVNFTISTF